MKIYFAGSIRGGRDDVAIYHQMITYLQSLGQVLTEHVGDMALTQAGDDGPDDRFIHDRDMQWLLESDVVIAEVSTPSLGVGYELGRACALEKPVFCLYRPKEGQPVSAMIAGSPAIQSAAYSSLEEATHLIDQFVKQTLNYRKEGRA